MVMVGCILMIEMKEIAVAEVVSMVEQISKNLLIRIIIIVMKKNQETEKVLKIQVKITIRADITTGKDLAIQAPGQDQDKRNMIRKNIRKMIMKKIKEKIKMMMEIIIKMIAKGIRKMMTKERRLMEEKIMMKGT
jgi:hypothetical protein